MLIDYCCNKIAKLLFLFIFVYFIVTLTPSPGSLSLFSSLPPEGRKEERERAGGVGGSHINNKTRDKIMNKKEDWVYGGIDPGNTGAFAYVANGRCIGIIDFIDFDTWFEKLQSLNQRIRIMIELQEPRPPVALHSAFTSGRNYQAWIQAMKILKIPYDEISPNKWVAEVFDSGTRPKRQKVQRPENIPDKEFKRLKNKMAARRKKELKGLSLERAKRLYPYAEYLLTRHDRAEALLLAHYCWLRYGVGVQDSVVGERVDFLAL